MTSIGRREFIAGSLLSSAALFSDGVRAQMAHGPEARVEVLLDEPIGAVSPDIYGHFTEHLGGVIYDGIWVGENSKIPNTGGIRTALVEHMRRIKAPVVRWPGGIQDPGAPWYSTVAHLVVQLRKPPNYSEQQFYQAAANVFGLLDPLLPAHLTWDWYRDGDGHTGQWPPDPGAGFFLDDPHNLDNEIFDI